MNWASFSLLDVLGLSALAAALALWLYLRQPRAARLRVSTLRFWESAPSGSSSARKRKLREPWALLAQILFLMAIIAALGNPRLGTPSQGRDVAVVIDAGAWSQMHPPGGTSWVDDIRAQFNALLQRLPSDDRITVMRADLDGAPVVPFTTDRATVRAAMASLQPSSAVADIPRALAQARAALESPSSLPKEAPRGLLVYIGPGFMDQQQARAFDDFRASLAADAQPAVASNGSPPPAPPEFFIRLVGSSSAPQNIGIARIALQRTAGAPDEWGVMTQVKNYNDVPARVRLSLSVGGHVFREDDLSIAPDATQTASDDFTSRAGGLLQAQITPSDDLPADNQATIVLPSSLPVSVAVVSSRPTFAARMKAVLSANPYVKTDFVSAGAAPPSSAVVVIYDGSFPSADTKPATISFVTAAQGTPATRVRLGNWNTGHTVTRWIQSRDVTVRPTQTLTPSAADTVLASSPGSTSEPLILAREEKGRKAVIIDFDPLDSNFTEEPAFPLLMAASIEWMTHPIVERGEFLAAGSVDLNLPLSRIAAPSGRDVLFAGDESSAHFFADENGIYHITSAGQSLDVPVNVPALPSTRMASTVAEAAALPAQPVAISQQELWRFLVALALIALWLEWRLFYFRRDKANKPDTRSASISIGLHLDNGESQRETEQPHGVLKL